MLDIACDPATEHDWRRLQAIKNTLLGRECEAVELYPSRNRRDNGAPPAVLLAGNTDPAFRFPFGFPRGGVTDSLPPETGIVQRPLDE